MPVFGRQADQDALNQLLSAGSAALLGPPGIGKTTLARSIVNSVWVDLEGVEAADVLQTRLARALDSPTDEAPALRHALTTVAVVVLDGAEGCLPHIEALADSVFANSTVLVTAQRRPQWPAATMELGPLDPTAGAKLLRTAVGSTRLAQTLNELELVALSEALDGVPLALELAATRLRIHSPRAVRDQTLNALHDARRPQRQHLLHAVAAAVQTVSDQARELLTIAALLPGGFRTTVLAAAAGGAVDSALLELLDASLVHPLGTSPPTFRVLAPIREVARPSADSEVIHRTHRNLAVYALPRAENAMDDLEERGQAQPDLANLLPLLQALLGSKDAETRLRAAIVLGRREHHTGPLQATVARDQALANTGPAELRVKWGLLVAAATFHLSQLDAGDAVLTRIVALAPADDPLVSGMVAIGLSTHGDHSAAVALIDATTATTDHPRPWFQAGTIHFHAHDLPSAKAAFQRARDLGGAFVQARATYGLCAALRDMGASADELSRALAGIEVDAFPWLSPRFLSVKGVCQADQGDIEAAQTSLARSAEQLFALGDHDDAHTVALVGHSLDFVKGTVPQAVFEPPAHPAGQRVALLTAAWRGVALAARGEHSDALAIGVPAVHSLLQLADPWADELAATLATALGPARAEQAESLLADLPQGPLVAMARACLDGVPVVPQARTEQRIVAALAVRHTARIRVAKDGRAFTAADGQRVDISRRRVLRRVLGVLAIADGALTVGQLCERVWPGERLVDGSGTRRVHVAISSLRGLGLRGAIVTKTLADGETAWQLVADRRSLSEL
ncbi:MAG: hypothetical protein ACI855_003996 [Myxococcota bacterium]|jgi:tetratricopeptide (TPR) repeat protein